MAAVVVMGAAPVMASLAQGYPIDGPIPVGSLVSLASDGSGKAVISTQANQDRLIGVVVAGDVLTLSSTPGQVQIITNGNATAIVSTSAGDIKIGDYIAVSEIAGVGMKATSSRRVLGIAQQDFSASSPGAQLSSTGEGSSRKQIALGEIPVQIGVTTYGGKGAATGVSDAIQNFANAVAGRTVTVTRLAIAGLILVAALISATVLLYSAVRNSIVAIGRNPLAKGAVYRSLFQIIGVVILILAVASGAMYLVIR